MAFGYGFVALTSQDLHDRRKALDAHGTYAQLSVLGVIAIVSVSVWLPQIRRCFSPGNKDSGPKSPVLRTNAQSDYGWTSRVRSFWTSFSWWCGGPLVRGWGTKGEWICASSWFLWLLYLCVRNTAPDYWHITKRFAMIPTSLLPFHYLLAMRSRFSPIQLLTRMGHEELKIIHQIHGRILIALYVAHGSLYINGFVLNGWLLKRIQSLDVIFGLTTLTTFIIIGTTSLNLIRDYSYRTFYVIHVFLSILILEPMYFHTHHTHIFVYETLAIIVFLNLFRVSNTHTYDGQISVIPGTDLIQVTVPLKAPVAEQTWQPGQHVFLSQVSKDTKAFGLYDLFVQWFYINPFTVASLPAPDKELLLVARTRTGSTRPLAALARNLAQRESASRIPLTIEGPYGGSSHIPDLEHFERILFVAGGIGATFTVPLYRKAIAVAATQGKIQGGPKFIWAVRSLADTRWAFPAVEEDGSDGGLKDVAENGSEPQIYLTRSGKKASATSTEQDKDDADDIELTEGEHLLAAEEESESAPMGVKLHHGRPDIVAIVDEVFSKASGPVAVFACGPRKMTDALRRAVGKWVYKGQEVFYKAEVFGY